MDGSCEVDAGMPCVWVEAIARAGRTPYAEEIHRLNPPLDWRLEEMSSWVTFALDRDEIGLAGDPTHLHATDVTGGAEVHERA